MKLLLFFTFFVSFTYANDCTYTLDKNKIKLTWTAYKTPLKAGVKGSFDQLGISKILSAKNTTNLFTNIEFDIKTNTVNTGNKDRDKKLATFFFAPLGPSINGKIVSLKKKVMSVDITFNKVKKTLPLKVEFKNDTMTATGVMDILDFNGSAALKGINKACFDLHEGKTWSDVALKLEAKYSKSCN